jgi:hypothetical protein
MNQRSTFSLQRPDIPKELRLPLHRPHRAPVFEAISAPALVISPALHAQGHGHERCARSEPRLARLVSALTL